VEGIVNSAFHVRTLPLEVGWRVLSIKWIVSRCYKLQTLRFYNFEEY
jgi:hypothetical protein